jgi:hypothetical protein
VRGFLPVFVVAPTVPLGLGSLPLSSDFQYGAPAGITVLLIVDDQAAETVDLGQKGRDFRIFQAPATADRLRHRHRLSARANGSAHVGVVPL